MHLNYFPKISQCAPDSSIFKTSVSDKIRLKWFYSDILTYPFKKQMCWSQISMAVPCDRARQWLSPMEISTSLVVASSSISFGLRAVASEEPQPKQAPQPHAYTCCHKFERDQFIKIRLIYRTSWEDPIKSQSFQDFPAWDEEGKQAPLNYAYQ